VFRSSGEWGIGQDVPQPCSPGPRNRPAAWGRDGGVLRESWNTGANGGLTP
jgi:hypothetical protein